MSVEQIRAETGCEELSIKAVLGQYSAAYRAAGRVAKVADVTKDEEMEMLSVLKNLATSSDCDAVRCRSAMYVYEEAKGRNEPSARKPEVKSGGINILILNRELLKAREAIGRVLEAEVVEKKVLTA